jgi:uncharacterized membrane protein YcaP (DUF421 family)
MWDLTLPWWQLIIRGLVVYAFLIFILRMSGKRQIGQMSPFDLVFMMVISNSVQNSMNGGDNSIMAGVLLAATLIVANLFASRISFSRRGLGKIMQGEPRVLLHNGSINRKALQDENITHDELMVAIRQAGFADVLNVRSAILEVNGSISVIPLKH